MLTHQPAISNLKTSGTDLEKAIFNGFLCWIKDLNLLCIFHLQQNDKRKLTKLKPIGGGQAINTILANIYGRQYRTMMEYGLADFNMWFVSKRKAIFQNSVIECPKKNTNIRGLFYNNSTECQHYLEKKEQSFRKGTVENVVKHFSHS